MISPLKNPLQEQKSAMLLVSKETSIVAKGVGELGCGYCVYFSHSRLQEQIYESLPHQQLLAAGQAV